MTPASDVRRELRGAAAKTGVRERPEDGGIAWHEELNAFECRGCGEFHEVRSAARRTPAALAETKEALIADHAECWKYRDAKMALDARRHRKAKTLQGNLAGAGLAASTPPSRNRSLGAPAQRVSWRGRAF